MSLETQPTPQTSREDERPFVSVLIPTRNETGYLLGCLEALAAQDYPRDRFEVILIDGESDDATLDQARLAHDRLGLPDRIETNPRRTTATALNLGLTLARGDVIVRVDGHTRVDPSFISASVEALRSTGADAVGGPIRTISGETGGWSGYPKEFSFYWPPFSAYGGHFAKSAIALAMASRFGIGDASFRLAPGDAPRWTDSVPFAAYRRDVFERVGRFAEDIDRGEDDEFNYRLREAGGRILLTPAIGSAYYARDSLGGLLRQYWGYGIAKANVLARHPRSLRPRHFVPSALVLTLALGTLLAPLDKRFGRLAALAGGAYAVANAIATLSIARKGYRNEAPYLPAAFACIHFGAGTGMLYGFVRLLQRKRRLR